MREFIIIIQDNEVQSINYGCKRKISNNVVRLSRKIIEQELDNGFAFIKRSILLKEDLLDILDKLSIMEEV